MVRAAFVVLCAMAMQLGCAGPLPVGERSSAIIGGTLDTGDPQVVLLISYPTDESTYFTCTASVLAPTLLATAAHCVDTPNHPGYVFGVFLGDDASSYASAAEFAAVLLPVAAVHAYPQYDPTTPFTGDVGVVVMASPLSVASLPIARTPLPSTIVGQAARIIGYGQTTYGTYNAVKYAATTTVASLGVGTDDTVIVGDAQRHSCVGDSGGPAIVALGGVQTIIGVDSYTDTTGCTEPSHYRRVDLYTSFFDSYLPVTPDLGAVDASVRDASEVHPSDAATEPPDAAQAGKHKGGCSFLPTSVHVEWTCLLFVCFIAVKRRSAARPA